MVAHCKHSPTVTTLVERHQVTWDAFNASWAEVPEQGAPDRAVRKLCDTHGDLYSAKPASMSEFFSKWRQIAKFESELGEPGGIEAPDVITKMLDELQVINGR